MKTGQTHHRAKYSDADVEEARTLRDDRPDLWSYTALGAYFGCPWETVRDWVVYATRTGGKA